MTRNAKCIYKDHRHEIESVAWSPDGKHIASGGVDRTVRIWEAMTGNTQCIYKGQTGYVRSVAWSPDGTCIASADEYGAVRVWRVK